MADENMNSASGGYPDLSDMAPSVYLVKISNRGNTNFSLTYIFIW